MIAITLVAGAAVFGFVNGQAGNSEKQYAQSAASNINYLNEHFVVVSVQFPTTCTGGAGRCAVLSIYNTGSASLTVQQISAVGGSLNVIGTSTGTSGSNGATSCASTTGLTYSYINTSSSTVTTGPIPNHVVPPATFTLSVPSGCSFSAGTSYTFQVLGLYGNTATYEITDSG